MFASMIHEAVMAVECPLAVPGLHIETRHDYDRDEFSVTASAKRFYRRGNEFRQPRRASKLVLRFVIPSKAGPSEALGTIARSVPLMHEAFTNIARCRNRKLWLGTDKGIVEVTKDGKIGKVYETQRPA